AGRTRLADRGIRRRRQGRGRRESDGGDEAAAAHAASAVDAPLRRPTGRGEDLESARIGPRRDGACAAEKNHLGRLGRLVGAAGEARDLPARAAQALRALWLWLRPLWPLRPGLRP